jgi:hypothetical protein
LAAHILCKQLVETKGVSGDICNRQTSRRRDDQALTDRTGDALGIPCKHKTFDVETFGTMQSLRAPNCARNSVSAEARAIRTSTGRPVVIPLAWRLGDMDPARVYRESYAWTFSAPGDQIQRLREATTLLAQFPKATNNETYDVYLLK